MLFGNCRCPRQPRVLRGGISFRSPSQELPQRLQFLSDHSRFKRLLLLVAFTL